MPDNAAFLLEEGVLLHAIDEHEHTPYNIQPEVLKRIVSRVDAWDRITDHLAKLEL